MYVSMPLYLCAHIHVHVCVCVRARVFVCVYMCVYERDRGERKREGESMHVLLSTAMRLLARLVIFMYLGST
jgi:hypothetical protein